MGRGKEKKMLHGGIVTIVFHTGCVLSSCPNTTLPDSHAFPTLYLVLWKVAGGHSGSEIGLCGATFETTFPSR